MPKLSVIVPVYNAEKYLDRCVESILAQTFTDFELILVDDGSPDNCPAMCDDWAKKDSRIKVIHKENGGVSSARNAGIKAVAADSEYFTFLDSDDTVSESCYYEIFNAGADLYDVLVFGINIVDNYGNIINTVLPPDFETKNISEIQPFLKDFFNSSFYSVCSKIYSCRLIRENDLCFDTNFMIGEDTLFNYKAFSASDKILSIKTPFYNYWQRKNLSLSRKGDLTIYEMAKRRSPFLKDFLTKTGMSNNADYFVQNDLDMCAYSQFYQLINPATAIPYKDRRANLINMYSDKEIYASLQRSVNSCGVGLGVFLAKVSIRTKLPIIVLLPSFIKKAIKG